MPCQFRGVGQARELGVEPGSQGLDDGSGEFAACIEALFRRLAAHHGFDPIQGRDLRDDLLADRRGRAALKLHEAPPPMDPAIGEAPRVPDTPRVGERVVTRISVDMQHTAPGIVVQEPQGGLRATAPGVVEDDYRWIGAAMASLVAGNGPEIIAARLPGPRGENRHGGLVHEQAVARLQVFRHPIDDRREDLDGATGPVPEHGPVEVDPFAPVRLALTVRCCAADYVHGA